MRQHPITLDGIN
jgi:hypothetical protein